MATRPLRPQDPRWLGGYQLLGRLGEGGMGTVYLGRAKDGRVVAVKAIRPEYADQEEFRARFRSEVNRVLQVPSFCTAAVLDADPDHETPYLIVDYVDGPSLQEIIRERGPMAAGDLHGVAVGVAAALTAIHGAGVIHRDLKPTNVLFSLGLPKVIDFGIARALEPTSRHTRTDHVMGTVAYMAPERLDSTLGETTQAADIFAWGAVVTYAGTGRTPFGGDSPMATAARILAVPPDVDGLPEPLAALVRVALSKDPRQRPTATELLQQLLAAGPKTALPPVPTSAPLPFPLQTATPWPSSPSPPSPPSPSTSVTPSHSSSSSPEPSPSHSLPPSQEPLSSPSREQSSPSWRSPESSPSRLASSSPESSAPRWHSLASSPDPSPSSSRHSSSLRDSGPSLRAGSSREAGPSSRAGSSREAGSSRQAGPSSRGGAAAGESNGRFDSRQLLGELLSDGPRRPVEGQEKSRRAATTRRMLYTIVALLALTVGVAGVAYARTVGDGRPAPASTGSAVASAEALVAKGPSFADPLTAPGRFRPSSDEAGSCSFDGKGLRARSTAGLTYQCRGPADTFSGSQTITVQLTLSSATSCAMVSFRHRDLHGYQLTACADSLELESAGAGLPETIGRVPSTVLDPGTRHRVVIAIADNHVAVSIDGALALQAALTDPALTSGGLTLGVTGSSGAATVQFADLDVR